MLRFAQNLSLQQKMAPQLIQSLQLLQMSTLELELEIKQQLELNPLLEESLEQLEDQEDEQPAKEEEGIKEEDELPQDVEEVDLDAILDDHFDTGSYNSERTEYDPNWEVDREPQENRITAIPPLAEQLYDQLALSDLEPEDHEIAEYIIGNLDERGYLGCTLAEIALDLELEAEEIETVLRVVQSFDPLKVYMFKEGLVRFATEKYLKKKSSIIITKLKINPQLSSPNLIKGLL